MIMFGTFAEGFRYVVAMMMIFGPFLNRHIIMAPVPHRNLWQRPNGHHPNTPGMSRPKT